MSILRSKPGKKWDFEMRTLPGQVYPVIRCVQEIPCDPCTQICPKGTIKMKERSITALPVFEGDSCLGCAQCVVACPGLAIVLVDERYDPEHKRALLTLPVEFGNDSIRVGEEVITVGFEGRAIGIGRAIAFRKAPSQDHRCLVWLDVPFEDRLGVAGIKIRETAEIKSPGDALKEEEVVICRCERVTKRQIVELIRAGYRDMNQIKAVLRTGMGACRGMTCTELILGLFREEGVDLKEVTLPVERPPGTEVPFWVFAGAKS